MIRKNLVLFELVKNSVEIFLTDRTEYAEYFPIINLTEIEGEKNMEELTDLLLGMPEGVANMQLPDPCLRDHYRN